jgi:hypothetical protein
MYGGVLRFVLGGLWIWAMGRGALKFVLKSDVSGR